jgi:hypothetical protein
MHAQHELNETDDTTMFHKSFMARLAQPFSVITTWLSIKQPAFAASLPKQYGNPMDDTLWESRINEKYYDI